MLRCHADTISYSKDIHVASQQWGHEEATKWESDADGEGITFGTQASINGKSVSVRKRAVDNLSTTCSSAFCGPRAMPLGDVSTEIVMSTTTIIIHACVELFAVMDA
jgi:hypothetical protein